MPIGDFSFYLAAIPAVILLGLAKGGFAGVGVLSMHSFMFISSYEELRNFITDREETLSPAKTGTVRKDMQVGGT